MVCPQLTKAMVNQCQKSGKIQPSTPSDIDNTKIDMAIMQL